MHVVLADKNIKENGRYTFLKNPELKDDYCLICDDDIDYPPNYVQNTVECFKRNGDDIVVAYYVNYSHQKFAQPFHRDVVENMSCNIGGVSHYRFGLGVAAFVPGIMNFRFTRQDLDSNWDMEMFWGQECLDRGVKVISPKRPYGFIKFIENRTIDNHALHH